MQKNWPWLVLILVLLIAGGLVWKNQGERNEAPRENAGTTEQKQPLSGSGAYVLDAPQSEMRWEGRKPLLLNYVDRGTIQIKEGKFLVENGMVVSGFFNIDMTSIEAQSTGRKTGETMLSKHLKSSDFFDAEQYPASMFEIASVKKESASDNQYEISGDLTIKGVTNPVTFFAEIYADGSTLKASGRAELDRSRWDIRYGSGKFFQNLGDNLIDDMFAVEFDLVAVTVENQ